MRKLCLILIVALWSLAGPAWAQTFEEECVYYENQLLAVVVCNEVTTSGAAKVEGGAIVVVDVDPVFCNTGAAWELPPPEEGPPVIVALPYCLY